MLDKTFGNKNKMLTKLDSLWNELRDKLNTDN